MNGKQWFILYVRSRSEKKLKSNFDKFGITSYLPLKTEFRKWSDRVKKVQVPLFTSYIFVNAHSKDISDIYRFPEVVAVLKKEKGYACLTDLEIASIKKFEESELLLEVGKEPLGLGEQVEVIAGPLIGMKGELIEKSGQSRFVLRLDVLDQVIKVQLPAYQLKKIGS